MLTFLSLYWTADIASNMSQPIAQKAEEPISASNQSHWGPVFTVTCTDLSVIQRNLIKGIKSAELWLCHKRRILEAIQLILEERLRKAGPRLVNVHRRMIR